MFHIIFLIVLALVWIFFAVIQDIRSREIANWLNFSLVVFALGFRFFYGLFFDIDFNFFYQGLIGFGIFFVLGNLFYYGRIFAGGDAKLMMALGAVLPFSKSFFINLQIFVLFFILFLISGMIYGLVFSIVLMLKNWEDFKKEFLKQLKKFKKIILGVFVFGLVFMCLGFLESMFFFLGFFVFILPYVFIFARAVDESCMVKKIKPKDLREGDWLYKNVKMGKKLIKAKWDGLSKDNIKLLQRSKKNVLIKQGIAFAPVFLISFVFLIIIFLFFGLDFLNFFFRF